MLKKENEKIGFCNEERVKHILAALLIIFLIKGLIYMVLGLISEVTHSNAVDGAIRMIDEITVFRNYSNASYHAPEWLKDFSLIETIEIGFYIYSVIVAFGYDLYHSRFPRALPMVLGILLLGFNSIRFFEIFGENLIWLIIFGTAIAALSIYLGAIILSDGVLVIFYLVFDIGGLASSVIGALTPIIIVLIFLASLLEFIFP